MISQKMQAEGTSFSEAAKDVKNMTVFTTHTPVEAGHDRFTPDLVESTIGPLQEALGLDAKSLLALGRVDPEDDGEAFCMTVLALKLAARANGVSNLHGVVARRMWQCLWPEEEEKDIPIGHVTNGVHVPSWLAPGMREFYKRFLGRDWEQGFIRLRTARFIVRIILLVFCLEDVSLVMSIMMEIWILSQPISMATH